MTPEAEAAKRAVLVAKKAAHVRVKHSGEWVIQPHFGYTVYGRGPTEDQAWLKAAASLPVQPGTGASVQAGE